MSDLPPVTRIAWLLVAALLSVVVALLGFMLKRNSGVTRSNAAVVAGAAFAGCLMLCLTLMDAAAGS